MYLHEHVTWEMQTLYLESVKPMVLVTYLLDNYLRSRAATQVLI